MDKLGALLVGKYRRISDIAKGVPEFLVSLVFSLRYLATPVRNKTVIVVEPNSYHGEIIPGYYKYFKELGYDVFVLCRHFVVVEKVWCRCVDKPALFIMTPPLMKIALKLQKTATVDFVFFTSSQLNDSRLRYWGDFVAYLGYLPKARFGCFCIEHHFDPDTPHDRARLQQTFLLTSTSHEGYEVPMLNPNWFGEIRHTTLNKRKRIFIFVGGIAAYRKSIKALIDAVRGLEKNYEFEVWLLGKGVDISIAESLPSSVRTFGRVSFDRMFQLLEDADYLLPLLDPDVVDHKNYLQCITSGSRQLILGFEKVPVIHSYFAHRYGFSDDDSIIYGGGGLAQALERALTISEDRYAGLQSGLRNLANRVKHASLDNLKKRIDERCRALG